MTTDGDHPAGPPPLPDHPTGPSVPPPLPPRANAPRPSGPTVPPPLPPRPAGPAMPPPLPQPQVQQPQVRQPPVPEVRAPSAPQPEAPQPEGPANDRAVFHETQQTRTFPCPNCGGSLGYDPAGHNLACPSCGGSFPIMVDLSAPIGRHELQSTMAALHEKQAEAGGAQSTEREVVCQSCGGHTMFSGTMTAVRCPYCNTPIQRTDLRTSPVRLQADGIIPMQIPQPQARENIEKWINSRWFAPREFKKYRVLGSFTSVYLSYYGYDADVTTHYTGMRGITRVERDNDGNTRTYTDWWPASGTVFNPIRNLTESANTGLDASKVRELEPWPIDAAVSYHPEFVAGHLARTYDGDAGEVFTAAAKPRIDSIVESTVRRDIGGDQQRIHSMNSSYAQLMFMYLLMPVWLLTVTFAGKPFQVYVNGVTGEVQGRRPWSKIKIAFAVICALIVIGVVVYFVQTGRSSDALLGWYGGGAP